MRQTDSVASRPASRATVDGFSRRRDRAPPAETGHGSAY